MLAGARMTPFTGSTWTAKGRTSGFFAALGFERFFPGFEDLGLPGGAEGARADLRERAIEQHPRLKGGRSWLGEQAEESRPSVIRKSSVAPALQPRGEPALPFL
jgi:hypothetical protein